MFEDCLIVFHQVPVRHRTRDGRHAYTGAELRPVYVTTDPRAAQGFKESLEDEGGMPACIGRAKLWRETDA